MKRCRSRSWSPRFLGRATCVILSIVLLAGAVTAAAAADDVSVMRLDNGVTVMVRENPAAPVVALSLMVRMGSRWETAEQAGISNLLQDFMVQGTQRRSGAELGQAFSKLGGNISAFSELDYSEVRASALARFWQELMALTAEAALSPKLAADQMDDERAYILKLVQRQHDSAYSRAYNAFLARLYGPYPYGLPPLGTPESLARIDHDTVLAWYRRFYQPERIVLSVSGDVKAAEVIVEARRLFGAMARGGGRAEPLLPAPVTATPRFVIDAPAQQVQIMAGTVAPSISEPDYPAVAVLSTIMGGGMGGRLFAELRDRSALAYRATSFYEPMRGPGALVLYLGTAPANAEQAERALMAQINRIRTEPVDAEELARAKAYLLGRYSMDRRTNERLAWYAAFYEVTGAGQDYPDRYRRAVEAVSAVDILRVAKTYLAEPAVVVLRPPR